jgi:hypothetical protein
MPAQLPPEIWGLVAGSFCRSVKDDFTIQDDEKARNWHGSLSQLCLVSKLHCALATPYLYEWPMTSNTDALMRTMFDRPDLARHVKCLDHGTWNHWYDSIATKDITAFNDLLNEHIGRMEDLLDENKAPSAYMTDELDCMVTIASDDDVEPQVNDAVALALMPNLERIHLGSALMPILPSAKKGSLSLLREAAVTPSKVQNVNMVVPPHLTFLADVAPYLLSLRLDSLAGMDTRTSMGDPASTYFPAFPNVTKLDLRDFRVFPGSLALVIKAFPKLADLRCEPGSEEGEPSLDAKKLQDVLIQLQPEIRRLHFDASEILNNGGLRQKRPPTFNDDLARLNYLEYLFADAGSVMAEKDKSAKAVVARIMPQSAREVHLSSSAGLPECRLLFDGKEWKVDE